MTDTREKLWDTCPRPQAAPSDDVGKQLRGLLAMTVPVPAGCVAPEGTPMSPQFRVSVQCVTDEGVHFIIHADGYSSDTLDIVASESGLALLAPHVDGETQPERIARTIAAMRSAAPQVEAMREAWLAGFRYGTGLYSSSPLPRAEEDGLKRYLDAALSAQPKIDAALAGEK